MTATANVVVIGVAFLGSEEDASTTSAWAVARPAYRSGETTGTSFRPGVGRRGVTVEQRRPTYGSNVDTNLNPDGSAVRADLEAIGERVVFAAIGRAHG
jgi:hypothetical protein